ncbi:MAG: leucine-rich repeat domain-containing protein [Rikenellaceae bacterium]
MKKGLTYLFASILALGATSCAEDSAELPAYGETIEVSFNATTAETTKSTYSDIGTEYQFNWMVGDELELYPSDDTETAYSFLATTGESSSATFSGSLTTWEGEKDLYVLHNHTTAFDCSFSDGKLLVTTNSLSITTGPEEVFLNFGLLVGVMKAATTSPDVNIPDVTLNQIFSFLRIIFEGDKPENVNSVKIISTNGEWIFPTSAEIDPSTGEILNYLSGTMSSRTLSTYNSSIYNVSTVAILPTEITVPLTLTYSNGETTYEYNLSSTQTSGFFARNTVHIGTVNWADFTAVEPSGSFTLSELNADGFDLTQQFSELYITIESSEPTIEDFAGLQTLLNNQTCTDLDLYIEGDTDITYDLPTSAFAGINTFDAVILSDCDLISSYAFQECTSLCYIEAEDTTTTGWKAFVDCSALTDIHLPKLALVGAYSFYNCTELKDIVLSSVDHITNNAFENCTKLESVELATGTTADDLIFRTHAFYNCTELKRLKIGSSEWTHTIDTNYSDTNIFGGTGSSENISLYIYDTCTPYLQGTTGFKINQVEYTFNEIYLNDELYDGGIANSTPSASVPNATKSEW